MAVRKLRIKKKDNGWFLAVPRWWGTWDVIEGLTFESAWAMADYWIVHRWESPR